MKGRARAMAVLAALMAIAFGMVWYGKREPEKPKRPVPGPATVTPVPEGGGTPAPVDPLPPHDPPVEPHPAVRTARGWRFGDNWNALFQTGPAALAATCGRCHAIPAPDIMPAKEWKRISSVMDGLMIASKQPPDPKTSQAILDWYVKNAPAAFDPLPAAPDRGSLELHKKALGPGHGNDPMVSNVNIVDVDGDGKPEILVCDCGANTVSMLKQTENGWEEMVLANCPAPGHTAVVDADGDGKPDIVVAGLGSLFPTDDPTGYVMLLHNEGAKGWTRRDLATGLPRVADVEPVDIDGDGDVDFIVGAFGWRKTGFIGWLRNDGGGKYTMIQIAERTGPIHCPVVDLDGDGRPDFVMLVAQEAESIIAWMNRGGRFEPKVLFESKNPMWGSSGMQVVDLDRDGDPDILFTNGDAMDDPGADPKPYHGVQWLENKGSMEFEYHDIGRCYGAYRAVAADLDGDGDLDVAVAVLFGAWNDPRSSGLLWYENDGAMHFTRHDVATAPSHLITLAAGDVDGDGIPELVSGRMVLGGAGAQGEGLLLWKIGRPGK